MPKRSFSLFRSPTQERIAPSATEREAAAQRLFTRTVAWVSALSVFAAVGIHVFISKQWSITLAFAVAGPTLSALGYAIERVLEAHTDSLMEGKFASLQRQYEAIPVVVRDAVAQDVDDIKSSMQFMSSFLECTPKVDPYDRAPQILQELQTKMENLVTGSFEVEGDDYYKWLGERLGRNKASEVHAISHRRVTNYRSDSREHRFVQQNHEAIAAKTKVTRIFVLSVDALKLEATWSELLRDFVKSRMIVHFVFEDELAGMTMMWLMGGGLSTYDGEVAFYDRSFLESPLVEATDHPRALVPKATIFLSRHPFCAELEKIYTTVFATATGFSGDSPADARGNLQRFQILHNRYLNRLRAQGLRDSDEAVAVVLKSLAALGQAEPEISASTGPVVSAQRGSDVTPVFYPEEEVVIVREVVVVPESLADLEGEGPEISQSNGPMIYPDARADLPSGDGQIGTAPTTAVEDDHGPRS